MSGAELWWLMMMLVSAWAESLLTRDSRKVERKKSGQPKARKKDQWVKR
jgi:ribosomal protein S9